jgi:hypothetical protein
MLENGFALLVPDFPKLQRTIETMRQILRDRLEGGNRRLDEMYHCI